MTEEETDYKFCTQCGTQQPCHKKKDGNWECDVCGYSFDDFESQSEEDTMIEEEEFF